MAQGVDSTVHGLIRQYARKHGIDPAAALSVAAGEGGIRYGAVGDQGTSYGPFQLHVGGALPADKDAAWANSPAGVEYALRKMAESGARGLTGNAAIETIIRRFERPADPNASIRNALPRYSSFSDGRTLAAYLGGTQPVAPAPPAPLVVPAGRRSAPYQQPLPFPSPTAQRPGGTMPPTPKNLPALIRKPVTPGAFPSGSYFTPPGQPQPVRMPQPLPGEAAAAAHAAEVRQPGYVPPVRMPAPPVITRPGAISQPVTPRAGSITNPAAPAAPSDINTQATGLVQTQIQPIIDEINRSIAARSASGTASIKGYTDALAAQLAQQAATSGAPYQQAQAQQAGADAALAQRLSGAGTSLGDELRTKLMQADAGTAFTDQVAGQVAGTGQGASNASYATGNASLSDLIARGAAAKTYGESLPGIARLGGLQQTGQYQGQLATDLATQLGQVQSKVPGLVSDTVSTLTESRDKQLADERASQDKRDATAAASKDRAATAKAVAERADASLKERQRQFDAGQITKRQLENARVAAANAKARAKWEADEAQIDEAASKVARYWVNKNGNPMRDAKKQLIPYDPYVKPAAPKAPPTVSPTFLAGQEAEKQKIDSSVSTKKNDGKAYNSFGEPTGGTWPKTTPKATAGGKMTSTALAKYGGLAATIAENAFNGFATTDKDGNVTEHPAIDYQAALNEMGKAGILSLPGGEKLATYWLKKHYPAGVRGAPGGKKPLAGAIPAGPLDALLAGRGSVVNP